MNSLNQASPGLAVRPGAIRAVQSDDRGTRRGERGGGGEIRRDVSCAVGMPLLDPDDRESRIFSDSRYVFGTVDAQTCCTCRSYRTANTPNRICVLQVIARCGLA